MGSRRSRESRGSASTMKERASMSFMLVVMFFAVFGVIVLTEIFFIDERRSNINSGIGAHRSTHRLASAPDHPDYEEVGPEDYAGLKGSFDEHVGLMVQDNFKVIIPSDPRDLPNLPLNLEIRLPQLDPNLRLTHAEWLPVTHTRFKFFVYSAYFDDRIGSGGSLTKGNFGLVRVIGATKYRGPDHVWCRLWYPPQNDSNGTISLTVAAKIKMIRENWSLKYSACFIICPLPEKTPLPGTSPEAVSIVARLRASPTNRIRIQNRPDSRPKERRELAVCVKPLHYTYNRVLQLVEFIELQRILGATHVTLYNDTVGPEAGCALKYYANKGIVTLLQWHHLDMVSQREIRTEGLFAALNDCLYRSMYSYDFVELVDLDEFIIPRNEETVLDLIKWMETRVNLKTAGAFSFQNAFFYLQWADDPHIVTSQNNLEMGLTVLRKTRRRAKLHPHKQRSKYICKPRDVVEAGNHFVWEFIPGHGTVNVPAKAAILQHYRVCEFGGDDCIKTQSVVDRTAYRYSKKLLANVEKTWHDLKRECDPLALDNASKIRLDKSFR